MVSKITVSVIMLCSDVPEDNYKTIESILNQTFKDFELLILSNRLNDIRSLKFNTLTDENVRIVYRTRGQSEYAALNKGLKSAIGKYVCVIDSNDIFFRERLERQVEYMEQFPRLGCTSVETELVDERGGIRVHRINDKEIKLLLLAGNSLIHSSLMFRRVYLEKYKLSYNKSLGVAAIYDFHVSALRFISIKSIDTTLLQRRIIKLPSSQGEVSERTNLNDKVRLKQLAALNIKPKREQRDVHLKLMKNALLTTNELSRSVDWLNSLLEANESCRVYNSGVLHGFFEKVLTSEFRQQSNEPKPLKRLSLLNLLVRKFNYKSYLEIGVNRPEINFDHIKCHRKVGVDPVPLRSDILGISSDEYFGNLQKNIKFDLIFIDGLHHSEQVLRDIENSLNYLSEGGMIVCHDMLPENEIMQLVPRQSGIWTGDCWKAWAHLRMTRADLEMFVLKTDYGLGLIRKGRQQLFKFKAAISKLDYIFFSEYKDVLMNTIDEDYFFNHYLGHTRYNEFLH